MRQSETMNSLRVNICEDASDAIRKGYLYRQPVFKPIEISYVVVVKDGTVAHRSTVDLVLETAEGQKYVTMLTGALLRTIPTEFGPAPTLDQRLQTLRAEAAPLGYVVVARAVLSKLGISDDVINTVSV